ncbi:MAG: hypothetical protein HY072_04595 [Deltaproteobacteria bacterium]|nr:hypothetical protein [Deltaproteobacteria bacterium]
MRILFSTYAMAFQNPGGGERVILDLKKALNNRKHDVQIYNPWRHNISDFDVIHYFSTLELSMWTNMKDLAPGVPFCVTPVMKF